MGFESALLFATLVLFGYLRESEDLLQDLLPEDGSKTRKDLFSQSLHPILCLALLLLLLLVV